jgi:hypothetical protein
VNRTATAPESELARLPWRGSEAERPRLALPPQRLPLRLHRRWRKAWRWVGAFDEELMLCAASVRVGPGAQTFWAVLERGSGRLHERTRLPLPGARREVAFDAHRVAIRGGEVEAELELDMAGVEPIECACANGEGGFTWTRKAAGVGVAGDVEIDGRRRRLDALAVVDDSAGYHRRRTSWLWSCGVGVDRSGRPLAWNLVSGINDPPRFSERAIWVDGVPGEPGPVSFDGLDSISFADGARMTFDAEAERARSDRFGPLFRSEYRAPFGSFSGSLEGGIELESGVGVMEAHDAVW